MMNRRSTIVASFCLISVILSSKLSAQHQEQEFIINIKPAQNEPIHVTSKEQIQTLLAGLTSAFGKSTVYRLDDIHCVSRNILSSPTHQSYVGIGLPLEQLAISVFEAQPGFFHHRQGNVPELLDQIQKRKRTQRLDAVSLVAKFEALYKPFPAKVPGFPSPTQGRISFYCLINEDASAQ